MKKKSVTIIIPLFRPEPWLPAIKRFIDENSGTSFLLVLTRSKDDPCAADIFGWVSENTKIMEVSAAEFNHGATREFARHKANADFVVFLTQDAEPVSSQLITELIAPLLYGDAIAVSYGRQIPREGAAILESFPRLFNYVEESQIRSFAYVDRYGVYTFFCSNSCAAWSNAALNEIGGFKKVLTNEDYFAVAELLQRGYKIAYVPMAVVKHSHKYTLWQEFQRYFDTGYVRAVNPKMQQLVGQAESRGLSYLSELMRYLWRENPRLIPYALLQSSVKWLGFRVGFFGKNLPTNVKRRLSQQSYYWNGQNSGQ